jgi:hypothetical protein
MYKEIINKEDIQYPLRINKDVLPELDILDSNDNWLSAELILELLNSTVKRGEYKCQ